MSNHNGEKTQDARDSRARRSTTGDRSSAVKVPLTLESIGWLLGGAVAALSALSAGSNWLDAHVDARVEAHLSTEIALLQSRVDVLSRRVDRHSRRITELEARVRPWPDGDDEASAQTLFLYGRKLPYSRRKEVNH